MTEVQIEPYQYHALLCCGKACDNDQQRHLMHYFKQRLLAIGLQSKVRVNRAGCLGVCQQGAIMVVYPQGIWYRFVDESAIDQIIAEHFQQGNIVQSLCFHQYNKEDI